MDLPTCPACGQSVIDDDATACPFCGASLSDKPGSAGSRPSAPAPQAESKQQISKRAARPTETDDDNPFGAVPTAAQTAIHATRKPARGCLLKVVCPMCETTGFVPGKAAGRDVRCANPQCLMPVFTAPKAESEATSQADAQPEPAAPSPAPVGLYIGAAVVTVIVGGCIWAYFLSGTRQVDQATFNLPPPIEPSSDPFDVTAETSANADAHGPSDTVEPGATPTFVAADIIKAAPQEMIVQARSGETRDKAWCRRLIADAFARIGQTKQARAELDHLLKIAPESGYYCVDPLVTMAWQELAAGDVESARSIANEASSLAENLPNIGPRPLSTAAGLAAVLTALGEAGRGKQLIKDNRRDLSIERNRYEEQLAAMTLVIANVEARRISAAQRPRIRSSDPLHVATALTLGLHDRWTDAITWSRVADDDEVKSDSFASVGWLLGSVGSTQDRIVSQLMAAANGDSPAVAGRTAAAVATGLIAAGRGDYAGPLLEQARAAVETLTLPELPNVPDEQGVIDFRPVVTTELRVAARAAVELAVAQAAAGRTDEARASLAKSVRFAQATAPPPAAARGLQAEIKQIGKTALESKLTSVLKLRDADQAHRARRDYRRRAGQIHAAAEERLDLQADILVRAAQTGLETIAWDLVQELSVTDGDRPAEPLLETAVPWALVEALQSSGDSAKAGLVEQSAANEGAQRQGLAELEFDARKPAFGGSPADAGARIDRSQIDTSLKGLLAIRMTLDLVDAEKVDDALSLSGALSNPVWREELTSLVALRATRRGKGPAMHDYARSNDLSPDERVAAMYGVIVGLLNSQSMTVGAVSEPDAPERE